MPRAILPGMRPSRGFVTGLVALAVIGFAGRLVWIFAATKGMSGFGDDFYYHTGAILLADGKGYVDPFSAAFSHRYVPAADHPPLYLTYLALPSWLGAQSYRAHQVMTALLGTGTIIVVGLLVRRLLGERAGLIAAALSALYPGFWIRDARVLSESLAVLLTAVTLLLAYRFRDRPTVLAATVLGGAVGLAALARSELLLLSVLLVAPLLLLARVPWRRKIAMILAAGGCAAVLVGPWAGYNATRFTHPVLLSTQLGATLAYANCDSTYYGSNIGSWAFDCATTIPGDGSVNDRNERRLARSYIEHHLSRVPVVVAARLGRTWWVYAPRQTLQQNTEPQEHAAANPWLISYFLLLALAIPGAVRLRRRGIAIFPLMTVLLSVCISVATTFGTAKYRSPAEVVLVVLAAAAIDAAWAAARRRRTGEGVSPLEPAYEPVAPASPHSSTPPSPPGPDSCAPPARSG
jgi:4-amino-4-deoxy-L-arabinose transferase-like glycosyltransferase